MRYSLSILALTALTSSCVTALDPGVNCKGSSLCPDDLGVLLNFDMINDHFVYQNGDHIVCIRIGVVDLCAFPQKTRAGLTGKVVKELAEKLHRNCEGCGSAAVDGQDVKNGELTINYVSWT